ncbi:thioesterase domain-containing protein [Kitasatospora sp. HPMI-4]|uniref:thioesterase domain-containing protein n=1 Tax=Kitasatospora sp. HPMI-4 TaxID=3448443 RepID=UPI003F1ABB1A
MEQGLAPVPEGPRRPYRDQWEAAVAEAYADELDVADVSIDTAFSASGDDEAADRIADRLFETTRARLPRAELIARDTVERVAAYLRERAPSDRCLQLPADFDPHAPSLFYFHSASGTAMAIRTLRSVLPVQSVGVRAAGLEGEREVPRSIEEFASIYLEELLRLPAEQPYLLCGFSTGGAIAFEVACRLLAEGRRVAMLALIDSQPPDPSLAAGVSSEEVLIGGRLQELLRRIGVDVPYTITVGDAGVVSSLKEARVLAETVGPEVLRRQLEVFARTLRADRFYHPGYYAGDLHYFNAHIADDLVGNWEPHARRVIRHRVEADHHEYSIFPDPGFRTEFVDAVRDALPERP